ncbi:hypothetical protein L6164_024610 [Bauhinia variegata]|uniref:Uncharacterized protein n=1 Tax=Bauhinia variegata TaxID=167791 RepID=A0ACB9LYW9_BAUVA|nr:hypothetical protein L6164_024610 [Bauhinia variegata]
MGRVKLQIKRIENTTNRQVTFSKRRNGLIKKAYELSVLCDVDVALIMFSPSGRASLFSGSKSIEEILQRYVNLPPQERGSFHRACVQYIQKVVNKLKAEADQSYQVPSPMTTDSQLEDIQREIFICKTQLEEMEKRLRIFEGDPSEITTLCEAEYREHVLGETLKQVQLRRAHLAKTVEANGFAAGSSKNFTDWLPHGDPQSQIPNFVDVNGLVSLRDQQVHAVADILSPTSSLLHAHNLDDRDGQMSPRNGLENNNNKVEHPEFAQVNNLNSSPWEQLHPTGGGSFPVAETREGQLLDWYFSQYTPPNVP